MLAQARQRPALVPSHNVGAADNVGGDDCRQFALLTDTRSSSGLQKIVRGLRMAGNLAKLDMRSRRQTPRRHWAIVSRRFTTAGATVLPTMANVPKIHARTAGYIVDDLRRRRLAVDKLLKEVGLEKADLSNPESRLPQTAVFHLMERAAGLTGDASYGLRLGASVNPRDRGLLGFIALNSSTLIDAMANIQRFYKVGREGHDCEIERFGPQVAFRYRIADPALRGLRHTSEYLAATVVRGCRDLTWQSISPVRAEFIHEEPDDRVEYFKFLGCPVKFGAEWDAVIYAEETTRLLVKVRIPGFWKSCSHLPEASGARSPGAKICSRGPVVLSSKGFQRARPASTQLPNNWECAQDLGASVS